MEDGWTELFFLLPSFFPREILGDGVRLAHARRGARKFAYSVRARAARTCSAHRIVGWSVGWSASVTSLGQLGDPRFRRLRECDADAAAADDDDDDDDCGGGARPKRRIRRVSREESDRCSEGGSYS